MNTVVQIKPMSVNEAWKGKTTKSAAYLVYQHSLSVLLPAEVNINWSKPLKVCVIFGFSSRASDIDNPLKPLFDTMEKKYAGFNDNMIYQLEVHKHIVKKGNEFISIQIQNKPII